MTSPELGHLQLLTMVGELGSLGRAAEKLGISQPAASKRMDQLERRLGLRLLDRNSRGSALTAEGKAVCQWAEKVMASFDALLVGAAALRADLDNDLRVASSMTLAEQFVPRWIGALRRQLPEVVVSLRMTNSKQVAELAAAGEVGLGFIEAPSVPRGLSSRVVGTDRLVVVVGPDHPWARRREPVGLAELAGTRLLVRENGSGTRETLERVLSHAEVAPAKPLLVLDANAAMRAAVADGAGPAVMSMMTVRPDLEGGRLIEVPVTGMDLNRRLRAVWSSSRPLTDTEGRLLQIAVQSYRTAPRTSGSA
jgi:DNA-binding transcriptional LysR family regulator